MKRHWINTLLVGAILVLGQTVTNGAPTVWIDMDPSQDGVQSSIVASAGQMITVDIVVEADSAGISSYGVSVQFDTAELSLNGSPAATENLPDGFQANLTTGVASEREDTGSGLVGEVLTFEATTFNDGPVSKRFVAGSIAFTVDAPAGDAADIDVVPGLFNTGFDAIFDNAGAPLTPGLVGGSVVVQEQPVVSVRPNMPWEENEQMGVGREIPGTNSFGADTLVPELHSQELPTPPLEELVVPDAATFPLPNPEVKRYYLTIRYYGCNPWFRHPYLGTDLRPELFPERIRQIISSVQTTNPDWPGRGKPIEELIAPDDELGEPLVSVSGYFDQDGNELVIDENNTQACQDWEDQQTAEKENAQQAAAASGISNFPIPDVRPVLYTPFYGLYCLRVRICVPVRATTNEIAGIPYRYWVRFPYTRLQPVCWRRWWWHKWRSIANRGWVRYPWRPLCVPWAVIRRAGPNWVWNVTNANRHRRWCLYGLRYFFTPFRAAALPKIAQLNSTLVPAAQTTGWLRPWPYPKARYWPFRPYFTRWFWFRRNPWFTYRRFPPVIQATVALPKLDKGAGFVATPVAPESGFPLDPPLVTEGQPDGLHSSSGGSFFRDVFDTVAVCTVRGQDLPLGDNNKNGVTSNGDTPIELRKERFDTVPNEDLEDDDGS